MSQTEEAKADDFKPLAKSIENQFTEIVGDLTWDDFPELSYGGFAAYAAPVADIIETVGELSPLLIDLVVSGSAEQNVVIDIENYFELTDDEKAEYKALGYDVDYFKDGGTVGAKEEVKVEKLSGLIPLVTNLLPAIFRDCRFAIDDLACLQLIPVSLAAKSAKTKTIRSILDQKFDEVSEMSLVEVLSLAIKSIGAVLNTARIMAGGDWGKAIALIKQTR